METVGEGEEDEEEEGKVGGVGLEGGFVGSRGEEITVGEGLTETLDQVSDEGGLLGREEEGSSGEYEDWCGKESLQGKSS